MIIRHYINSRVIFVQKQANMKFPIFDQTHGLTPLKKSQHGHCVKSIFVWSRKACFLLGWSSNIISRLICPKSHWDEFFTIFEQNHGLTPLTCPLCKIDIFSSREVCFLTGWSKNIISRPILSKNKQRGNFDFWSKSREIHIFSSRRACFPN